LNRQMLRVLNELEFRDDVGVLVLTGEGDAWSAGMDLKEYFRETEAQGLPGVRQSQREAYAWWERLRNYQKVTIAMVNGWCFGGWTAPSPGSHHYPEAKGGAVIALFFLPSGRISYHDAPQEMLWMPPSRRGSEDWS